MRLESGTISWERPDALFSGFENPEDRRVEFEAAFAQPPVVILSLAGFSLSNGGVKTVALRADEVGEAGFTLVIKADRLDSVTAAWIAYGA